MISDNAALAKLVQNFLEEFSTNTMGYNLVLIIASDAGLNVVSDKLDVFEVGPILHAANIAALKEAANLMATPKGEMH